SLQAKYSDDLTLEPSSSQECMRKGHPQRSVSFRAERRMFPRNRPAVHSQQYPLTAGKSAGLRDDTVLNQREPLLTHHPFDNSPPAHVLSNFCPLGPSKL